MLFLLKSFISSCLLYLEALYGNLKRNHKNPLKLKLLSDFCPKTFFSGSLCDWPNLWEMFGYSLQISGQRDASFLLIFVEYYSDTKILSCAKMFFSVLEHSKEVFL